jgi:hypothetical protein
MAAASVIGCHQIIHGLAKFFDSPEAVEPADIDQT